MNILLWKIISITMQKIWIDIVNLRKNALKFPTKKNGPKGF